MPFKTLHPAATGIFNGGGYHTSSKAHNEPRSTAKEIERASWSQGIQTLISILIGAALSIAVSKAEDAKFIVETDYAIRLISFILYCVSFFWFYHKFYVFFYRRASIFWIFLPSIVGCALIATAYSISDTHRFAQWTLALCAGGAYSTGVTAFSVWRGKYKVIDELPAPQLLLLFYNTMVRSCVLLTAMVCCTAYLIWGKAVPDSTNLDIALFVVNGSLFVRYVIVELAAFHSTS